MHMVIGSCFLNLDNKKSSSISFVATAVCAISSHMTGPCGLEWRNISRCREHITLYAHAEWSRFSISCDFAAGLN